jgi:hypothetical protein
LWGVFRGLIIESLGNFLGSFGEILGVWRSFRALDNF